MMNKITQPCIVCKHFTGDLDTNIPAECYYKEEYCDLKQIRGVCHDHEDHFMAWEFDRDKIIDGFLEELDNFDLPLKPKKRYKAKLTIIEEEEID